LRLPLGSLLENLNILLKIYQTI